MDIQSYSPHSLANALANDYTPVESIEAKNQFEYFTNYLGPDGLKAQSFVVEKPYISKDFLHDYASYYAFCFENYSKDCKRIHFFKKVISADELRDGILNDPASTQEFWSNYLGFIVAKPIPMAVFGFSVLMNYNFMLNLENRYFWGVRKYKVHVFGHELEISSLAFQEQDTVVSACATTAIWCMFNKASTDFHTILKTPTQITRDAATNSPDGSRLFPNRGLSVLQICHSISNSGLVTEVKQPNYTLKNHKNEPIGRYVSNSYTKKILNAYSKIGIPIILVIKVPGGGPNSLHAITVSGFFKNPPVGIPHNRETSWLADNIVKIYAHDDQWGPFVKIDFQNDIDLKTLWTDHDPSHQPTYVTNIIVPTYPKVRISYEDIESIVLGFDLILSLFFDDQILYDLVWDIRIDYSEGFKCDIKKAEIDPASKMNYLFKSLPKYVWTAACYIGENKVFEFSFDATDVNMGMIALDLLCYLEEDDKKVLYDFLEKNKTIFRPLFSKKVHSLYYDFLLEQLR